MDYVKIPRMVNELMQVGFWEVDEALLIVLGIFTGVVTQNFLLGLFGGFILSGIFAKYKQGKNRGFLVHLIYWYGFAPAKGSPFSISYKKFWVK